MFSFLGGGTKSISWRSISLCGYVYLHFASFVEDLHKEYSKGVIFTILTYIRVD